MIQLQKFDEAAVTAAFTALAIAFVKTTKGRKRLAEAIVILEAHAAAAKVVPLAPTRGRLCEDTFTEAAAFLRQVELMVG